MPVHAAKRQISSQKNKVSSHAGGSSSLVKEIVNLAIPVSLFLGAKGLSYVSTKFSQQMPQQALKNKRTKPSK